MAQALELTGDERVERFCDLIAGGMSVADAGSEVGYTNGSARVMASRHKAKIHDLCLDRLNEHKPVAIDELGKLLKHEDPKYRLPAIKMVLDKTGVESVTRHEISVEHRTDEQLRKMAADYFGQHGMKVIEGECEEVDGCPADDSDTGDGRLESERPTGDVPVPGLETAGMDAGARSGAATDVERRSDPQGQD